MWASTSLGSASASDESSFYPDSSYANSLGGGDRKSVEERKVVMAFWFHEFYQDDDAEAAYEHEHRYGLMMVRHKALIELAFVGAMCWALFGSIGMALLGDHSITMGMALVDPKLSTGWCFWSAVIVCLPYCFMYRMKHLPRWYQDRPWPVCTLAVLVEVISMWYLVLAPENSLKFAHVMTDETTLQPGGVFGFGVGMGTLCSVIPAFAIFSLQMPPRYSLVVTVGWMFAGWYVGWLYYGGCEGCDATTARGLLPGHCFIISVAALMMFAISRSDDKMRRIMFIQRRQLHKAHIEVVAAVSDPFRVSNLQRWMQGGGDSGVESSDPLLAPSRFRTTSSTGSALPGAGAMAEGGVIVPYGHLLLGPTLGAGATGCVAAAEYFATKVAVKAMFMSENAVTDDEMDMLSREVSACAVYRGMLQNARLLFRAVCLYYHQTD
jgi:hypothetical protein